MVSEEKDGKSWQARRAAKRQQMTVRLEGLTACRVATALTQKELANLIGSNQTTIADLERWDQANSRMVQRLCDALKVAPEDLISPGSVEDTVLQEVQVLSSEDALAKEKAERRSQVNRVKRRAHYTGAPGTVLLRGLKDCRIASGLTQRKLAKRIGTNQTTIAELEKGTYRGAYMKTVQRLCQALKASPVDLICREPAD